MTDAECFLALLFRGAPAGSTATVTAPTESGWASRHCPVEDPAAAAEAALQASSEGLDAYVGLAARRSGLDRFKRGARGDLTGLGCVWLDVDVAGPGHASASLPAGEEDVAAILAALPLPPSMVVHSGGGYHAYWLLDEWCADVQRAERACSAWQAAAIAAAGRRGWHVDDTSDAPRVLRVPGTQNYKAAEPRPVVLECAADPPRYSIEDLERIASPAAEPAAPSAAPSAAPPPDKVADEPVDLAAVREALSRARRSKAHGGEREREQAELLGRVLDGKPLAEPGERHRARVRAVGLVAYWVPAGTPWEAALEVLRPCLLATPLVGDETFEAAVEKTRLLYESSMRSRALADERRRADAEAFKRLSDKLGAAPRAAEVAEAGGDWMDLLVLAKDGVRGCELNARLLLDCAPEVAGTIAWNDFSKQVEVRGGPLAGVHPSSLPGAATEWLQRHYAFRGGEQLVRGALARVARASSYDPVAEYLGELAWDGVPRIDEFLEQCFGAVEDPRYVRAVSRRWLIGLVARALRPGGEMQNVLVLEGRQGCGKTRGLRALVGDRYYLGTSLRLGEKDFMQAISGAWLVELAELASLRRADTEKVKQFITERVDKFRPPYAAAVEEFPRRCVFVGTTNESEYLTDRTGNRRYWPVRVRRVDVDEVARVRDLVLAEAVAAFRAGERWWLLDDEAEMAEAEAEERLGESGVESAIERWWYGEAPARRPRRLTLLDVADLALHLPADRVDHVVRSEVGHAMSRLGFARRRPRESGERVRYYEPTAEMLSARARTTASRAAGLALVEAVKAQREETKG